MKYAHGKNSKLTKLLIIKEVEEVANLHRQIFKQLSLRQIKGLGFFCREYK